MGVNMHRIKIAVSLVVAIFGLIFLLPAIAEAEMDRVEPGRTFSIDQKSFGMHVFYLGIETKWPAVPFGTLRLWDAKGTRWNQV